MNHEGPLSSFLGFQKNKNCVKGRTTKDHVITGLFSTIHYKKGSVKKLVHKKYLSEKTMFEENLKYFLNVRNIGS